MKLYQLANQYRELMDLLESESVDYETIKDTLDSVEDAVQTKMEAIAKTKIMLEANIEAVTNEIKRLTELKKTLETNLENMLRYVDEQLKQMDKREVKTSLGRWAYRKKPLSVEVVDENKVPEAFIKIEKKVDKRGLAKHVKSMLEEEHGEIPEDEFEYADLGIRVINNAKSLQFR